MCKPIQKQAPSTCNKEEHKEWSRRSFLHTLGLAGAGTFMVNGMPMAFAQATPLSTALGNAPSDRVLLIVRFQGGNDGLNTVVPIYDYDRYANFRPTIRHELTDIYKLSDDFGIPAYMNSLENVWGGGCMKVVHGAGYENQNLSHFKGTDNWSSATDDILVETGYYGRYFENIYPDYLLSLPEAPPALQIGGVGDIIFTGSESNFAFTIANTSQLERIASSGNLFDASDVPDCTQGEQLSFVRSVLNATLKYSGVIRDAASSQTNDVEYPDTNFGRALAIIARTVKARMATRVYMVTLNGFDTHANQPERHQELLTNLSDSISAFYRDLESTDRDNDVITMTFSEFGRRVSENGSNGTDHGTAAPMLLFGPALNGNGFIGEHPSLSDLDRKGNMKFSQDYVDIYGTIMQDWLCIDPSIISQSISREYTQLDLGFSCSGRVRDHDYLISENFIHTPIYDEDSVFIRIQNNIPENYEVSLYNILGQRAGVLFDDILEPGQHDILIQGELPRLNAGIYIYNIKKNNRNYSKKIVIS